MMQLSVESAFEMSRPAQQPRIFAALFRIRRVAFFNNVIGRFQASRLRVGIALFLSVLFWFGLFFLFFEGFNFLSRYGMIAGPLVEMLFGLFFGSLLLMLMFSTGIILYAGLFASKESEFLLAQPIPTDQIFAFKFQEAMFFACWGFLLLGSPLMIAYGLCSEAPLVFYPLALGYFLAFALIPGSLGAILCLAIALLLPRRKWELFIGGCVAVVIGGGLIAFRAWQTADGPALSVSWIHSLLRSVRLGNLPFLPSQWITRGLLAARTSTGLAESGFYFLVLVSNGLFAYLVTAWTFRLGYRKAYDRVQGDQGGRILRGGEWLDRLLERLLFPIPRPVRVLLRKDIRVFLRDPVQWLQVLIFSSLLGFYFINLGRVQYYANSPYWKNLIGFFNLAVMGLLLATFTSRFVFPMLSLEGRKFWLLGLSPVSRAGILWGKFAFAAGGSLMVTLPLTIVGAFALRLEPMLVVLQFATLLILCFGVSGISVGLGARFPDMRETDPSKIAAGFGGTLNLVASLVFIFVVILLLAVPCHLYSAAQHAQTWSASMERLEVESQGITVGQFRWWLAGSVTVCLALGAAAVYLPMRIGRKAFEALEF